MKTDRYLQATQQYQETEEEELNRAMALSMSDSQTLSGQETGVMDASGQSFGRAQREHYDTQNWAMTVPGSHAREIILPPDPVDRKRQPGTPAFFKPTPETYRLSALIKILHEIPMAREALLNTNITLADYGHGSEWWDGTAVNVLRVVNVDEGYQSTYAQDIIYETQRLMAFLDKTERAYGSTEALAKIEGEEDANEIQRVQYFLESWQRITTELSPEEPLVKVFESTGVKRMHTDDDSPPGQTFHCLPVRLDQHIANQGMSLYDALDEVMWNDNDTSDSEVFLGEIGQVVTFDLHNPNVSGSGLGIEIPAVWYPDRYLESSIPQAKSIRDQKDAVVARLKDLEVVEQKLLRFQRATNSKLDALSLLSKATAYFEQTASYRGSAKPIISTNGSMDAETTAIQPGSVLEELKTVAERVSIKLKSKSRFSST